MDDRRFRDAVLKQLPLKQLSNNETQYFNIDMEEDFPVLLEPPRPISTKIKDVCVSYYINTL